MLRGLWLLAGAVVAAIALRALANELRLGPGASRAAEIAVPAGLTVLLVGAAVEAPRPRLVQWVLVALSALVIPLGAAILVAPLVR